MTSEFQTETILFDQELHELAALRRERDLLAHLAQMFQSWAGRCQGECTRPLDLGVLGHDSISCCDLRASFERYHEVSALEKRLDERIKSR